MLGGGPERIEPVDLDELDRLLEEGAELIDVRERDERDDGYIAGSRNIPYRLLPICGADVPTDRPVVTICESGARAASPPRSCAAKASPPARCSTAGSRTGPPAADRWSSSAAAAREGTRRTLVFLKHKLLSFVCGRPRSPLVTPRPARCGHALRELTSDPTTATGARRRARRGPQPRGCHLAACLGNRCKSGTSAPELSAHSPPLVLAERRRLARAGGDPRSGQGSCEHRCCRPCSGVRLHHRPPSSTRRPQLAAEEDCVSETQGAFGAFGSRGPPASCYRRSARVAALGEGRAELLAMGLVAHRERQLDLGLTDRELHPLAVVLDRDDVPALRGDELEQLDQLAGPVGETGCARRGSGRQVSPWRITWIRRVGSMFPPERIAHGLARRDLAGEERRDRRRPAPRRPASSARGAARSPGDLIVSDGDDLVEQLAEDRQRQLARLLDRDAIGDREPTRCRQRTARTPAWTPTIRTSGRSA